MPLLQRSSGALLVVTALAALGPAPAQTARKPAVKEKTTAIGAYAGKIVDFDEEKKTLKVKVYGKTAVPRFTPGNPRS
jgi:hypothetical protein